MCVRVKVNAKINLEKMDLFLADKPIDVTDSMEEPTVNTPCTLHINSTP